MDNIFAYSLMVWSSPLGKELIRKMIPRVGAALELGFFIIECSNEMYSAIGVLFQWFCSMIIYVCMDMFVSSLQ